MPSTYLHIYNDLLGAIDSGDFAPGSRLPTETELARRYNSSRPTAARALNQLASNGLVDRKIGSGTYVVDRPIEEPESLEYALLIPGLGDTEIFEPICGEIVTSAHEGGISVTWASGVQGSRSAQQMVDTLLPATRKLIEDGVDGIFFAPLEFEGHMHEVNHSIVELIEASSIPLVLLDRDYLNYPKRSKFDLVGINNVRAAYSLTEHLSTTGAERILFVARENSAPTVMQRIAGFRNAQMYFGVHPEADDVQFGDPTNGKWVGSVIDRLKPDGIVCANDVTAAEIMQTLLGMGVQIPNDLVIAGFDDVKYARLLQPSLTTMHQPTEALGKLALEAMDSRLSDPQLPPREIRAEAELVIRNSTRRAT